MMNTLQVLITAFNFIFGFWPLLLLSALKQRGKILTNLMITWGFWAVVRLLLFLISPTPPAAIFIPEPYSTILFLATGGILFLLFLTFTLVRSRRFRHRGAQYTVEDLLTLSPSEFGEMVAALYRAMGHKAKRTGQRGDHGMDIIVHAKNGEKWIVQCKRWRKPVGEAIVREFYGTLQHEKAAQGAIIATKGFTRPAQAWAKGKPIHLYSGEDFLKVWHRLVANRPTQK